MDIIQINSLVRDNLPHVLIGIAALTTVALFAILSLTIKLARLNRRYQKLMQGADSLNLEWLLEKHMEEMRQSVGRVTQLQQQQDDLNLQAQRSLQHVGVVRFNAFDDMGGDMSFAIALLDGRENGVVLSSLFGRSESRVYAKPIERGQSAYLLTAEEKEAVRLAAGSQRKK